MVTEEEWSGEVAKSKRFRLLSPIIALGAFALIFVPAMAAGNAIASGFSGYLVSVGLIMALMLPLAFLLVVLGERRQRLTDEKVRRLNDELSEAIAAADREAVIRDSQVQRQRFESRLANALDMAEGEPEVIDVIERSFGAVLPDAPVELLLADNSHAHLVRMAAVGPDGEPPSCGVDSPDRCPAARRAQIQVFPDSDDLDACPKLRNRPQGRLSALCVPVSIMGRTVGVIHATGEPQAQVEDDRVDDLATLAKLAGARIGLLRVMAETQLQASTDTLTGLLNRRAFSEQIGTIPPHQHPVAVAMADLDHFKTLNDTYGHETGDRALRLFARVLRDSLRSSDIVSRYGGEEFAIAFPECSAIDATRSAQHGSRPARCRHHRRWAAQVHRQLRHHRRRARRGAQRRPPPRRRRAAAGEASGARPGRPARGGRQPGSGRRAAGPGADAGRAVLRGRSRLTTRVHRRALSLVSER